MQFWESFGVKILFWEFLGLNHGFGGKTSQNANITKYGIACKYEKMWTNMQYYKTWIKIKT